MTLKQLLEQAVHTPAASLVFELVERYQPWSPNQLQVLTYHVVDSVVAFEAQMRYLAHNYTVVSMNDVLEAFDGRYTLPRHAVLITFDDADRNFAEKAWPSLRRYQLPVTLFVPTAFPDNPEKIFWWDRLEHALMNVTPGRTLVTPFGTLTLTTRVERRRAIKELKKQLWQLPPSEVEQVTEELCAQTGVESPSNRVLGWDELRQLAKEGVTLAPHSRSHSHMGRVPSATARIEAEGSLEDLRREIGGVPAVFAYPGGWYNRETPKILEEAGYLLAFTTRRGTNRIPSVDRFQLRRNNIGPYATVPILRARILHGSPWLDRYRPDQPIQVEV